MWEMWSYRRWQEWKAIVIALAFVILPAAPGNSQTELLMDSTKKPVPDPSEIVRDLLSHQAYATAVRCGL